MVLTRASATTPPSFAGVHARLRTLPLLCALIATGCATVAARHQGTPLDDAGKRSGAPRTKSGLVISGHELSSLGSPYFGAVRITFENPSSQWVQIRSMRLSFGTPARDAGVLLPWGSQLDSWFAAIERRNLIREANAQTALAVITLGGGVTRLAAGDTALGRAGGLVAAGALSVSTVDALGKPTQVANSVPIFPSSHLLGVPFAIPPGLFADKWALLQTSDPAKTGCIRSVVLDYETAERGRERVLLRFRESATSSEWQAPQCRPGNGGRTRLRS